MTHTKPLEGITVFEIGQSVAAPFAGLIFSDLGAEVMKVENPKTGDHARGWGPPFWQGAAAVFHTLNRGKKDVAVDFADPGSVAELRKAIVARADVVIQNMRAGVVERYGLGPESLRKERPDLIYCNLSAFGETGPLANKPGYDPLMQAFAGLMSVTGEGHGRPPVRAGISLVDMGAGMWSTIGILASLIERARTKRGTVVSTSLYETALTWMSIPMAGYQASRNVPRAYGSGVAEIVPYQCFMTRDGWLMIAAGNDGLYRKLCHVLNHPEWAEDDRFRKNGDRVANRDILIPMLEQAIGSEPMEGLMARLDAVGIPNAPLQTVDAVADHPQTAALDIIRKGPEGSLPVVGLPISFDGDRPAFEWPTPALGEHTSLLRKMAE
jgi:crotonobetainyl-CoA:carnitine CoA-transferase CaiB-like acyl-CoA transferase